jgi:CheY-like chemotaxis protein
MGNGVNLEMQSLSFLVVDDEAFIQKLAVRILGQMGGTDIETASNGKEALDHISSAVSEPDILLVDLNMPIMGGVELLNHLAEKNFSGAIVLVSGADEETLAVAEGLAKNCDVNVLGYLTKPITPQSLTDMLNRLN